MPPAFGRLLGAMIGPEDGPLMGAPMDGMVSEGVPPIGALMDGMASDEAPPIGALTDGIAPDEVPPIGATDGTVPDGTPPIGVLTGATPPDEAPPIGALTDGIAPGRVPIVCGPLAVAKPVGEDWPTGRLMVGEPTAGWLLLGTVLGVGATSQTLTALEPPPACFELPELGMLHRLSFGVAGIEPGRAGTLGLVLPQRHV
jgi:hypothetical protein